MTSTTDSVARAAVATVRAASDMGAVWRVAVEQQWHLLAVAEADGGYGGSLTDLADVVRALAGAGLSTPIPELYAGATGGAVGVALPVGNGETLVPWGRWCADVLVLDGGDTVVPVRGARERENLAHEPVDELTVPGAGEGAGQALARWRVLHTARLVGGAVAGARRTAAYAGTRVQFGRPIARFQAVAALVAEAHAQSVLAAAGLERALADVDDDASVLSGHAVAARAAGAVARIAHQVHGAIGVTQELGLEQLTRRLWAWRDLWQTEFEIERLLAAGVAGQGEGYFWSADA
ncbi:acyl-CoA dehydrogenase family protein [Micromonospora robiginosa]|uniref:Acyl-CoA dehydrogenase family protein n=1 Tax=Micromonospora robiginosa TaxID=2749844 RepID=A0A7L6B3L0_9ACTN|nr:acyl-CoA dehydrogenase family protein [Micromonospora ferruginea]QLQ36573.1 acyl-CoA dehydrogenase family protein [Micromonospora ferruginea]